jgi:hypothetical protein
MSSASTASRLRVAPDRRADRRRVLAGCHGSGGGRVGQDVDDRRPGTLAAQPPPALRGRLRVRGHRVDVGEGAPRRRPPARTARADDVSGDHQRLAAGQLVEGDADGAADRVLQRHQGRVGVAVAHGVERLGDAAGRDAGAATGCGDRQQRLLGEGSLGPR